MPMPKWWKNEDWIALVAFLGLYLFFAKFSTDSGDLLEGASIIAHEPMWWGMMAMGLMYRIIRKAWR